MPKVQSLFRADLHCHSTCSDGTVSPKELINLACEHSLQGLSITDHDSIEAYAEAVPAAESKGISLLSGVELSAVHRKQSVHVLAYGFALTCPLIKNFCKRHHERRQKRLLLILERLNSKGLFLKQNDIYDSLNGDSTLAVGRPHIALAMIKKGYVPTIQEAFQHYLGEGKIAYVPGEAYSVEETLDVIHQAKALAIIAHPHLIYDSRVLQDLLLMNFDGIEGYYARFPSSAHQRWIKIAAKKEWIITGGSDFHGTIKPNLSLGNSWVNEETFSFLLKHFKQNQSFI